MPAPRSTRTSSGCVPGSNSSSTSPSIVGTVTVVPSAACVIVRSTVEISVVALADEARVRPDVDEHVHVAGAAAGLAGVALASDADPLSVVDPGRDVDRSVFSSIVRPAPSHVSHGVSTIRPAPPQRRQGWARMNCPNTVFETSCTRPAPPQVGHADRRRARLRPAPVAGRARHGDANRDVPGDAASRLDELDRDLGGDVRAPRSATPAADAEEVVAEERGEEVAERAEVEARGRVPTAAQAGVPVAVVELAPLRVGEHLVRLDHLLEERLGVRVLGDVRVKLACLRAERLLDLGLASRCARRRAARSSRAASLVHSGTGEAGTFAPSESPSSLRSP